MEPGRKFRSRIRMDGSAVCTRDTTPRTEMGLNMDSHFYHVRSIYFIGLVRFAIIYLLS